MALVYLGLGSNLGNKAQNINVAIKRIELEIGQLWLQSACYESMPWGYDSEHAYLNAAILVNATLAPLDLLEKLKQIEVEMGRVKTCVDGYEDRIIDIDILFYDNQIINAPALTVPHPLLHKRDFVLIPLSEIAPELLHPVLNETIASLKIKLLSPESGSERYANIPKRYVTPVKRFCQTLDLRNDLDLIARYKEMHSKEMIWKEIPQGIKEAGILEMEIYLLGNKLFMILETPVDFNWDAAFAKLNTLPRQQEWEDFMAVFQQTDSGAGSSDKWKLMERIFQLNG